MSLDNAHASGSHDGGAGDGISAAPPLSVAGEIALSNIRKSFGVTRALDGCSFTAFLGEIHAIVGGNGSGKSTLAKVISGVLPVDSGQVSVLGHAPATPHDARALGIATVFQEVLVADECSVVDNLFLGADGLWSKSMPTRLKARAAAELMRELTGAEIDVDTLVGTLPLSIRQWITIGRALLAKPRVLILDESSAALDLDSTERLFARMRALRDAGSAVLIVTHRIAELVRISDRATVLRDGRDIGVLERSEITEENLLALMTGKSESAPVPVAAREVLRHDEVMRTRGLRIWPGSGAIDVSLHRGEILGVVGLDGQGQSEFVRILAGIDRAAEGAPVVRAPDGRFEPVENLDQAVAHGISYVSGDRKREGIFANLSIFENLVLPLYRRAARGGRLAIIDRGTLSGAFDWEAERLAIRMGDRSDKITSLSGGNQQKVLIGRAFALNPDILVLNDPARGVDAGAKGELYKDLAAFAARGKSVVYLSSEIEEFVGFCMRVLVFRHGSVFAEFTGAEIDPDRILEAMFGQAAAGARLRAAGAPAGEPARGAPDRPPKVGRIKIVEFDGGPTPPRGGRDRPGEAGPDVSAAPARRPAASLVPQRMKIVDFSKAADEAPAAAPGAGRPRLKIVEFDKPER